MKRIIAGLGYLEGYGHHPGVPIVVFFTALAMIAAGWLGGLLVFSVLGVMLCVGAYDRAKDYERQHQQ